MVGIDHVRMQLAPKAVVYIVLFLVTLDVFKSHMQSISVVQSFSLLDQHDLFHSIDHVELQNIFTELVCLNLSVVKKVLHNKSKDVGR